MKRLSVAYRRSSRDLGQRDDRKLSTRSGWNRLRCIRSRCGNLVCAPRTRPICVASVRLVVSSRTVTLDGNMQLVVVENLSWVTRGNLPRARRGASTGRRKRNCAMTVRDGNRSFLPLWYLNTRYSHLSSGTSPGIRFAG